MASNAAQAVERPPNMIGAAMANDPGTGKVMLFGGLDNNLDVHDQTWLWDGQGWTRPPANTLRPQARYDAATAADPATGTVVMFGGTTKDLGGHPSKPLNDTWVWDGSDQTWTPQVTPVGPNFPSRNMAMASDPATGTVLLYGVVGDGTQNETWSWNGVSKTWTREQPAASPSPRTAVGGMTHDGATGTIVLFGGYLGARTSSTYLGDTWVWSGSSKTWTNRSPATSPSGRFAPFLAYHEPSDKVVLFGGMSAGRRLMKDTWTWNGTTGRWVKQTPLNHPSARSSGDMAYTVWAD